MHSADHLIRQPATESDESIVYIVDDDELTRKSICSLLRSIGLHVRAFGTAHEFVACDKQPVPACLVLDVRLGAENGLELQHTLMDTGEEIPIIFMSAYGDIPMTVQAMKAGALDFLTKPFHDQDLVDVVQEALQRDRERLNDERSVTTLRHRYQSMTDKEKAVMNLVVTGYINRKIARTLELSEITIETYRALAMEKMGSKTLAEFVRVAEILGLIADDEHHPKNRRG